MIYLDNAAGTQCLQCAWDAMYDANREYGNVARGLHRYAEATTRRYEEARRQVAEFIQADPGEIVFTSGATEAINLVARGWGDRLRPSDEILVTQMEHHSNLLPWQMTAARTGARLRVVPLLNGRIDLDYLEGMLQRRVKLVAFPAVSNVLGTFSPIAKITEMAHKSGAAVLVDAAQSISHVRHYCHNLGVDFLAFSGHKMHGPTGIGVLYARADRLKEISPIKWGGGIVEDADYETYRLREQRLEAGTPPVIQAIGLGAACRYWLDVGMDEIHRRIRSLTQYVYQRLADRVRIIGPSDVAIISFTDARIHPHDLAALLSERDIAIRAGTHCAVPLHKTLGIPASARVSLSYFNTEVEINLFVEALNDIQEKWPCFG